MIPYYRNGDATLYLGDCILLLQELREGSADLISGDPETRGMGIPAARYQVRRVE